MFGIQFEHCFYIILAITLFIYYRVNRLKDLTKNDVLIITNYINESQILTRGFVKTAYIEFSNSNTVKRYLDNYKYLVSKKETSETSKLEDDIIERLHKDIELLNVSFLSTIVLDNNDYFEEDACSMIDSFNSKIKNIQILNVFKYIFTIISIIMFIKIMY